MIRPAAILLTVAAATCSIICGGACDFLIDGECRHPGDLFGPCIDNVCNNGLQCFTGLAGDICVPIHGEAEPVPERVVAAAEACASEVGDHGIKSPSLAYGAVLVACVNDGECRAGAMCEENIGACMYPAIATHVKPPPGATLGPCDDGECVSVHDECRVASDGVGSICAQVNRPEWVVTCTGPDPFCPNGQVCSVQDFDCVWPD